MMPHAARKWTVILWRSYIAQREREVPDWLKKWLAFYGPYGLRLLTETQFEAVTSFSLERLHEVFRAVMHGQCSGGAGLGTHQQRQGASGFLGPDSRREDQ